MDGVPSTVPLGFTPGCLVTHLGRLQARGSLALETEACGPVALCLCLAPLASLRHTWQLWLCGLSESAEGCLTMTMDLSLGIPSGAQCHV